MKKELTILIPMLNEEKTIEFCINEAHSFIMRNKINAEILVVDNGSTDNSVEIAKNMGARIIREREKGYGKALITGINKASGDYIIMGDADSSYCFSELDDFYKKLKEGYDLVVGNRYKGGIEKDAMPFLNKYLGTPVISLIGRVLYHNKIKDYNCGLRGFKKKSIKAINLKCTGMEFATEMIIKSSRNKLKICEVPTRLRKDGRGKPPHLNRWCDGIRHLKLLISYRFKKK